MKKRWNDWLEDESMVGQLRVGIVILIMGVVVWYVLNGLIWLAIALSGII